jgi:small subunit ribosomal protein S6
MLNIECGKEALDELIGAFRFSDAVLRHLVVRRDKAITEPSVMAQAHEEEKAREAQAASRDTRPPRTEDSDSDRDDTADSDLQDTVEPSMSDDSDSDTDPGDEDDADADAAADKD